MSARRRFTEYVRNGGAEPFVSLQIGAGAGFDAKLAGKEWVSEASLDDTIRAYETVGGEPLFNIGLGLGSFAPELAWRGGPSSRTDERREWTHYLDTPYGQLSTAGMELKKHGCTPVKYALGPDDSLDVVLWHAEMVAKNAEKAGEPIAATVEKLHAHGPVSVQWPLQPFEIFGLATAVDAALMATMDPEGYRKVCDQVRDANLLLLKSVFRADVDFVFLGGPGREAASPMIYEEFLVPDSAVITKAVHDLGGLVYTHICSPVEPFLTRGYYNKMGLDLFETLSPPPVGNMEDLAKVRRNVLPAEMCTRGNLGLDVLVRGTPQEVEQKTLEILEATRGYKHMVAASDYLFYDVPLENAQMVVKTVGQWKGQHASSRPLPVV